MWLFVRCIGQIESCSVADVPERLLNNEIDHRTRYGTGMCAGTRTLLSGGEIEWIH